jgi:fructose-specific component phosphotransferase system IIB-like protein
MKVAIQRLLGMSIEQDAKVKQAQDALATAKHALIVAESALAEAIQHATEYRQALAILRRPELVPKAPEAMAEPKTRKRA